METLWKEWREQRGPVAFGICAGIIWPLVELMSDYASGSVSMPSHGSGIVVGGGAIFAVFLAMATGYADLRQGIDTFWQARPIRIGRVFLVKLLVGMFLLAAAFAVVMVPDICTGLSGGRNMRNLTWTWTAFSTTWPIAVLLFGAGLFFVALIRDMAKAAFMTIWFGLLVYFLPLFFNGLKPLSVFERFDNPSQNGEFFRDMVHATQTAWSQGTIPLIQLIWGAILWTDFRFLGISLGGALTFTLLAVQAVKRDWRWQPGQKTIVWTLGASAALIFAIALYQVRSDLEPATQKDGQVLVNPVTLGWVEPPLTQAVKERGNRLFRRSIPDGVVHAGYLYTLEDAYDARAEGKTPYDRHCVLQVYRFPIGQDATKDSSLHCGGLVVCSMAGGGPSGPWPIRGSYVLGDRLYVAYAPGGYPDHTLKTHVATIDISNPRQPRLTGTIEIKGEGQTFVGQGDHAYVMGSNQWTLLSLKEADQSVVVAQWTFHPRDRRDAPPRLPSYLSEIPSAYLPCGFRCQVVRDRLVCTDGLAIGLFDLSEPNDPMLVYYENLLGHDQIGGIASIAAVAMDQDCLYLSTQWGLIVRRLIRHADGHWFSERIGYRAATPLERLSGRNVSEILLYHGYLIEADRNFGLLVYDISNPSRPRRVMYSDRYSDRIGIWNGLLYSLEYGIQLNFFDLPAKAQAH